MAGLAMLAVAAVGAAVQVEGQRNAAKAQEIQLEQQAEQEELSAKQQEVVRRRNLNRALASNIVGQQVSGIAGEGTPESIALANAKTVAQSEGAESLSQSLKARMRQQQAENIRSAQRMQSGATLLQAAGNVYKSGYGQ